MSLDVVSLEIPEVKVVTPPRFGDHRGYFSETYNQQRFEEAGIKADFIQDNQSLSAQKGTVRGLHFQAPPFAQAKLVRVLQGAVLDVAVDAREGSATYGKWVSAELTAEKGEQIFVPRGFLHGFVTLTPDAIVAYKVDNYYSGEHDGSVFWNDADLNIDWGLPVAEAVVSEKDGNAQAFGAFKTPFKVG